MKKLSLKEMRESMSHFLNFPDLEDEMERLVQEGKREALDATPRNGSRSREDAIADFLQQDDSTNKNLKMLISLSAGSLERLSRLIKFWFGKGTEKSIRSNAEVRRRVAKLMDNPDNEQSVPKFIRNAFALPANWTDLLKEDVYMNRAVRGSLVSKYSVAVGLKIEEVVGEIVTELGLTYEKGSVFAVDNKEVDIAIPSLEDPKILIMVSYLVTTASTQTSKASEQNTMYDQLRSWNRSRKREASPNCLFVNVIDGGGWISRRKDLERMWKGCDYCFSYEKLDDFRQLVREVMLEGDSPKNVS